MLLRHRPFGSETVPGGCPGSARRALHFAEIVEDADRIVGREAAGGGVVRVHLQHGRALAQLAERRRHVFSLAGEISASG